MCCAKEQDKFCISLSWVIFKHIAQFTTKKGYTERKAGGVISCMKIQHTIKHFHFEPRHIGSASLIPAMIPVYLQNNLMCQQFIINLYKIRVTFRAYLLSVASSLSYLILNLNPAENGWLKLFMNFEYGIMNSDWLNLQGFFQSNNSHQDRYCC